MTKKTSTIMAVLIVLALCVLIIFGIFYLENYRSGDSQSIYDLNEKVYLIKDLVLDQDIVDNVKLSNQKRTGIALAEISKLDQDWVESREQGEESQTMKDSLSGAVAEKLKEFQKDHPEFVEIFVTDKYGLNVGQTNVTSDYYQADEDWWIRAYNKGRGATFVGEVEYDESAGTEVVGIFFPITYGSVNNAIGVIKALVGVESLWEK